MNRKTVLLLAVALYTLSCRSTRMSATPGATSGAASGQPTDSTWNAAFESKIETLRQRYHIPGLSAGVVYQGKLVWKKGFGYADVDRQVAPDEHTVYQIASLTKTFGSIILMQQVEAGKISLDDPIQKYGIRLGGRWGSDTSIKIKHLLTHTAMGTTWNGFKPGYSFRYNGDWYGQLGITYNPYYPPPSLAIHGSKSQ
jgi:CubicO group peptidase (beta-lactamase class C family)